MYKLTKQNLFESQQDHANIEGWNDLQVNVLSNSISVTSGRCLDDNERLCAMELRLLLRRFHLE